MKIIKKVVRMGNSLAVGIPCKVVSEMDIKEGDIVKIQIVEVVGSFLEEEENMPTPIAVQEGKENELRTSV